MNINELERLTGITRQNIRFYEKKGLLYPKRNPENNYREYTEEDVTTLKTIKLLRKLVLRNGALYYDPSRRKRRCGHFRKKKNGVPIYKRAVYFTVSCLSLYGS